MFSRMHQRLGTAGFVISIVAVVLALTGGAYAAGKLTPKEKKEVEKIAKKVAKPGPAGPAGAPGAKGDTGAAGANGTNGTAGANGKSVVASAASSAECAGGVGGTKFEVEGSGSPSHVCNGKNGQTGFTATLPPGQTETGSWSIGVTAEGDIFGKIATISLPIPLPAPIAADHVVHVGPQEEGPEECEEGTSEAPAAAPGYLCIYAAAENFLTYNAALKAGSSAPSSPGVGIAGAILQFFGAEEGSAYGTFAVTADVE